MDPYLQYVAVRYRLHGCSQRLESEERFCPRTDTTARIVLNWLTDHFLDLYRLERPSFDGCL